MPATPNREHGELLVPDGLILEEALSDPTSQGGVRYNGTSFRMRDSSGVFDPRSGGGGLTENTHEVVDTLTHELAENADVVVTRSSGQVTSIVVWTDNTHTTKIRETTITRSSGQASVVVTKQYDGTGTLKTTLTKTITRSSGRVESIAVVRT